VYQNNEDLALIEGAKIVEAEHVPAKFDLMFNLSDDGNKTYLELTYATSLFSQATIQTYLARFIQLLNQVLMDTSQPIKDIDVLLETERRLILNVFNQPLPDLSSSPTVAKQFEARVKLHPNKIAVASKGQSLTYEALDQQANEVAVKLIASGLNTGDIVAVIAKRDVGTVVGFLGILKAGGAYMPIDADYPESRITYMLEDSHAQFILGDKTALPLSETTKAKYQFMSLAHLTGMKTALPVQGDGISLAYLIYTSGTTGKPKGVMVKQQGITRLVKNTNYANFDDVRMLQTGSLSFDASTFEIWGALLNGGEVFISELNVLVDHEQLSKLITEQAINTMWLTASLYNHLITMDVTVFDGLKQLLIGGEALSKAHVQRLLAHNDQITLINGYGPTETTTFAVTLTMQGCLEFDKIPIGKPIASTTTYIMTDGKLCGIGVPGELYIGGPGVASGYLNEPTLTNERFIDNPYGPGKLYKTGDLVKWLPDGHIDYLGRLDDQVKVRGHRIELGEIESALSALVGIDQGVVVVRDGQLHAYLQNPSGLAHETIEQQLKDQLPDYMIPTHYMDLTHFPVTRNGKVNKQALPVIKVDQTAVYVAPRTPLERLVATSYEAILEVAQVGLNDDFFKLGGHSLRALRLVNLLEAQTGKAIGVKHIFEAPKVVQLAQLIEGLADAQYERIPKAEAKPAYEMSSTQKRMYLLWKLSPTETVYNIPTLMTFTQPIDEEKLKTAIDELNQRHDILRTTFHEVEGRLVQVISQTMPVEVTLKAINATELVTWYEQAVKPFDLEKGPLYRIQIARTAQADYLFVDMHHIISDGMSSTIFANELGALVAGGELPPLDRQYTDYSEWMNTQDLSHAEAYWQDQLTDYKILTLPTDHPRPKHQQFEGKTEQLVIDEVTTTRIKTVLESTQTTGYMFFLSLISLLLSKLANQADLVIGTPVSGRIHQDTENMLGMFVNTLAMRLQPSGEKTFQSYLEEIKSQTLEGQRHQMYPFEDLVEAIVTNRDTSRNPLFDVMMVYQNNEAISSVIGATTVESSDTAAKFDLSFTLSDDGEKTYLNLTYATALFQAHTIQTHLARLSHLLDQVLTDITQPIGALNVLLEGEEQALLTEVGHYVDYPKDQTITQVFEAQVAATPTHKALIYNDVTFTYEALNAKANQLAHYLIQTYDIQPEDKVGLLLDRSEWMIIAILGILKAGAAYVPMSPAFPQARLDYIATTAEMVTTFVEADYRTQLKQATLIRELSLDDYPTTNPKTNTTPTNLAYVIFTSGTTGHPKGVMIEHHQVNNLTASLRQDYGFEVTGENLLFFSNYVFDVSVEQIFLALLSGYPLIVTPDNLWMDQEKFTAYLNKHDVTYLHMTPSLLSQIDVTGVSSLKRVVAAGESVNPALVKTMHEAGITFINGYGPTEATVIATTHVFEGYEQRNLIGKPVANTTVYLLDDFGKPVPKGSMGELHLGGIQIARGYLNQPDLTAEKFMPNPFQTAAQKRQGWNDRIYQTGDLVRMLEDGTLEYHGRNDFQVKIRGYRIELGEIEAALYTIPGITQAHVMALGESEHPYLGAYYISDTAIDQDVLDQTLKNKLPDYMVPSGYCHLTDFPLTVNGKLDRRALPTIAFETAAPYVAPQNAIESKLVDVYAHVLKRDTSTISTLDNFFKLGGTSIDLLRVVSLLKKDVNVSVEALYSNRTITEMADFIINHSHETLSDPNERSLLSTDFMAKEAVAKEALPEDYKATLKALETRLIKPDEQRRTLLLTGATGFLGAHLLMELLTTTNDLIYTLVRGADDEQAKTRLMDICHFYFTADLFDSYAHRIVVYQGDISALNLGLTPDQHLNLSQKIDCIVNVASNVKHYGTYEDFYQTNVLGVKHLIDFQETGKQKTLIHCSTVSLGSGYIEGQTHVAYTEDILTLPVEYDSVYLKTKAEAEDLLIQARSRGLTNSIIRLGNLQANRQTGKFQINEADNAFFSQITGLLHLGMAPDIDYQVEYTPIDDAATACVKLITSSIKTNEIYHVYNPYPVSMKQLLQSFITNDEDFKFIQPDAFYQHLFTQLQQEEVDEEILKFSLHLGLFKEQKEQTNFTIHAEATQLILQKLGFNWHEIEQEALDKIKQLKEHN
ncbi:MAG: amino acid adenylation domain-containing protein, partial [Defluviitaleaceae bacterium]|nr:amino acid adenylation domain-containing protein [Defluviitaleaceae bacterium]